VGQGTGPQAAEETAEGLRRHAGPGRLVVDREVGVDRLDDVAGADGRLGVGRGREQGGGEGQAAEVGAHGDAREDAVFQQLQLEPGPEGERTANQPGRTARSLRCGCHETNSVEKARHGRAQAPWVSVSVSPYYVNCWTATRKRLDATNILPIKELQIPREGLS